MNYYMDIKVIQTIIAIASFFILRFVSIKALTKIQRKYDYSKYRIRPIQKSINLLIFVTVVIVIVAIWGVQQTNILTFITSALTVVGVALVAQWSILSNITSSIIILVNHPVKLGETISIVDKDFNITGRVSNVGLFYVILKTEDEKVMIPNNVFLQKATKIKL